MCVLIVFFLVYFIMFMHILTSTQNNEDAGSLFTSSQNELQVVCLKETDV